MREDGYGRRYGLCGIRRDGCLSKVFQRSPRPSPARQGCYPLDEILLLCLLAALAGAECFTEIALFGTKKLALLRRFRPFKDGTPAHDHLGDILATLDAEQFQGCFRHLGCRGDRRAGGRGGVDGRPRADPAASARQETPFTGFRLSLRPSASCLVRSKWRKSPTRS
jgi:hypothetical protein